MNKKESSSEELFNKYIKISNWIIALGIMSVIFALVIFLVKVGPINFNSNINLSAFSSFGSFLSGTSGVLFSLGTIFIVLASYNRQLVYQKKQDIANHKSEIESRFFNLLNIQRSNSQSMFNSEYEGRNIFFHLHQELLKSLAIISSSNSFLEKEGYSEKEKISLAVLCFYYGAVGSNSTSILEKQQIKSYQKVETEILPKFRNWKNNNPLFFNGNQTRLGHYYRHLYQTVKFIDNLDSNIFSYREKYKYIKIIRAQLTTQEQVLIAYNSLSKLGNTWEPRIPNEHNKDLITKYNLIKNIPKGFSGSFEVRDFYPDINYEEESKTDKRKELEESYK
ncbi:putative phage abortive infection protein [Marivirga sp.]|uniref:putative phage abortive infection protein n=1 Tax=Marivirga sp. TaxID=2018662 RepID=UPI002D80E536|nr:putative phage abortive infection protein [Marivirga sp.]HET8861039.1 putative phage abortive infection protein [Marivirga sp.]